MLKMSRKLQPFQAKERLQIERKKRNLGLNLSNIKR
jgi:hypothetical protein